MSDVRFFSLSVCGTLLIIAGAILTVGNRLPPSTPPVPPPAPVAVPAPVLPCNRCKDCPHCQGHGSTGATIVVPSDLDPPVRVTK